MSELFRGFLNFINKRKGDASASSPNPDSTKSEENLSSNRIVVFDESDPENILSDVSRGLAFAHTLSGGSPYSTEGFAGSPEKQSQIAQLLISKFQLKNRGPVLDVGFGSNIHIADTFAKSGLHASAIDEQQHDYSQGGKMWHAPALVSRNQNGVQILSGDIADIEKTESQLRNAQFGLILFNGSWESGGNNWTVAGEVMEAKYHNVQTDMSSLVEFMDVEKDHLLSSCKNRLSGNGLIGIVSSRYAFHGAGFNYQQLPEEKLTFIDVYERFQRLGAKRIFIFGVSQNGFDQIVAKSLQGPMNQSPQLLQGTREQLRDVKNLPEKDLYSEHGGNPDFQASRIRTVKLSAQDVPELNAVARIDAMFAEF